MARILLLGQGGREHALAWRLSKELSEGATRGELFCCPGNPGMADLGECVDIPADDIGELVREAKRLKASLVISGPEEPLAMGVADEMTAAGITCLGPNRAAARLEASKSFARRFCETHNIPSPWYAVCDNGSQIAEAVANAPGEALAVKANGLCGGKGVSLCRTKDEALRTASSLEGTVVLEEFLEGSELSFFALVSNGEALPLGAARDYKRLSAAADAPNTGGMGAISAPELCDQELQRRIMDEVVSPVARGLEDYRGVLFVGLMLTPQGIKVLEFNVRFGDPECQTLMMRLEGGFAAALTAAASGDLRRQSLTLNNKAAACVVMANRGYPDKPQSGAVISGIAEIETDERLRIFQAGTIRGGGGIIAAGGRVLGVTASAAAMDDALKIAYEAVEALKWRTAIYRLDIGK